MLLEYFASNMMKEVKRSKNVARITFIKIHSFLGYIFPVLEFLNFLAG